MNGRELYTCIYGGEKPDRFPIQRMAFWEETVRRWWNEGLDKRLDPNNVLGFHGQDAMALPLDLNFVPRFPTEILKTDERYVILKGEFGVTKRMLRSDFDYSSGLMENAGKTSSMCEWLDFPVKDLYSWKRIYEERLQPELKGRIPDNWEKTKTEFLYYSNIRWVIHSSFPLLGLFGPLRELMGFENLVFTMIDNPGLIDTIIKDLTDFWLRMYDMILTEFRLDEIVFFEDMCSTRAPLISPEMFNRFFAPGYKKVVNGLREIRVSEFFIDTDGHLWHLIPELLDCGITGTHPCEINAGMIPKALRDTFPKFCLNGGINKVALTRGKTAIDEELECRFQTALDSGRYTPTLDHSAPPDISLENMLYFAQRYRDFCEAVS